MTQKFWPALGCGLGLRSQHYPAITEKWPQVDWFEAVSENYMDTGGRPLKILEDIRRHYPVALHGTALSIGSTDPLNQTYLKRLKQLADRIDPFIVSDHLCWSGTKGEVLHDLLPLPFTEDAICHVVSRVGQVQEFLGRKILLENVSTYVTYQHSAMPEWEFLSEVAKRSGCGILLDVNNIYVNAFNHRFDAIDYLKGIPGSLVGQIHLAGHTDMGDFLFDTHSAPVIDSVWELYREALRLWGPISTLIEWDEHIPDFQVLEEEAKKAKAIYKQFEGKSSKENSSEFPESIQAPRPIQKIKISLSEIQEGIREKILSCEENKSSQAVSLRGFLNPQGNVSGEERLAIYANGYGARIRESLSEVYEAVRYVLGDEPFSELSHRYIHDYIPRDYNLNFAGRNLPEFLKGSPEEKEFPFISDLAQLEWSIWESFHAFDQPSFRPGEAAHVLEEDWEKARIIFQPSVHLISSEWPILDIWRMRRQVSSESKNKVSRLQRILVSRKGVQVQCELVDENQYRLLQGLIEGKTLGVICEELAQGDTEEPLPISGWFSRWVQEGLIARLEFSHQEPVPSLV